VVEWDPDTALYVAHVPELPGAHTQAATLEELERNLTEALGLVVGGF
jgi:predicted RNase H-like HicB family nuclease